MKLPEYVRPYPLIWKKLPFLKPYAGNAIYPFIFLREDIYQDLLTNKPNPRSVACLEHEQYHRKREQTIGWFLFGLQYLISPTFRFTEELNAYKVTMKVLKQNKEQFVVESIARYLSGWMYLWSISYTDAKKILEKAWNEA